MRPIAQSPFCITFLSVLHSAFIVLNSPRPSDNQHCQSRRATKSVAAFGQLLQKPASIEMLGTRTAVHHPPTS